MPSIYEKPVWQLMWDMTKEIDLQPNQAISRSQVVAWFRDNYPRIKESTVSAHLLRLSTNSRSRHHYGAKPHQDDLFYQIDGGHFRLYDAERDPPPIWTEDAGPIDEVDGELDELEEPTTFAYERDLQNFLAKNLPIIEPGLHLYEEDEVTGLEFPAGGRFVDILALDANGDYVVIELKVSRGYDRVVGQLLRYMAWVEHYQAEPGQRVRGIIIAREISDDLRLACSRTPDIELFEYQLSVSLTPVAM